MVSPRYWLTLFNGQEWQEFCNEGMLELSFPERRWPTVQQIQPGDKLICYLTGVSRWVAVLDVISPPKRGEVRRWSDGQFPCVLSVAPSITLEPDTAVPVLTMRDKLSIFKTLETPNQWAVFFRGSLRQIPSKDARFVEKAISSAKKKPVVRKCDEKKLRGRKLGSISNFMQSESIIGKRLSSTSSDLF